MAYTELQLKQKALTFFREQGFSKTAPKPAAIKALRKIAPEYQRSLGHQLSLYESKKLGRAIDKAWEEYCV